MAGENLCAETGQFWVKKPTRTYVSENETSNDMDDTKTLMALEPQMEIEEETEEPDIEVKSDNFIKELSIEQPKMIKDEVDIDLISYVVAKVTTACEVLADADPDMERSFRAQQTLLSGIQCYRDLLDDKKSRKCH